MRAALSAGDAAPADIAHHPPPGIGEALIALAERRREDERR
jgi:hypothetical protein